MFSLSRKPSPDALPAARILPFRGRKSMVALDVEGEMLRFAQASGAGASARIIRVGGARLELSADKREDPAAFGAALKGALAALKISPREAVLSLPRAQVVLRPLQVPMVADVRELASIINFQISKDLPFRLEDAVVDFKVLRLIEIPPAPPEPGAAETTDRPAEKRLEVLVGAVRSDVVEFYRTASKHAGLKMAALGLRSVAAAYCASRVVPVEADAALLLVCMRTDETTIEIAVDQKLAFSRAAAIVNPPATGASEQDRAAFLQALEIEVVRSLHSFEGAAMHRPLQKVVVAGGTGLEEAVRDLLERRLNLPAAVLDLSACLDTKKVEGGEALRALAPVGLGLSALEAGGLPLDFANPKRPAAPRNVQRTRLMVAAAAALAVLFTLSGIRMNLVKKRLKVKQEVQAQLTDAEKKLPIYRRLKGQTKVINGWISEDQNWLEHIAYLSAVLPQAEELFVSTFTTTPQHLLRFSVQARTGELLAELDKKLRAAGYEVRPLSITPANDKNGYNFRTTVELAIPKKMKPDLTKAKPAPRPADDVSLKFARKS